MSHCGEWKSMMVYFCENDKAVWPEWKLSVRCGDTAEIIEDCLDELQPFIDDVKPEPEAKESTDFSEDDYMDCLETFLA